MADRLDLLAQQDERLLERSRRFAGLRENGTAELYNLCRNFAFALNQNLAIAEMTLSPDVFAPEQFREDGGNLFQLNVRGRILQLDFQATLELVSMEAFEEPYTLFGAIRCFNQEFLDRHAIEEQGIFFCVKGEQGAWKFFDARTYRTGPLDSDYLMSLFELMVK